MSARQLSDCEVADPPFLGWAQVPACGDGTWYLDDQVMGLPEPGQVEFVASDPDIGAFEVHLGADLALKRGRYAQMYMAVDGGQSFVDGVTTAARCGEAQWALAIRTDAGLIECFILDGQSWADPDAVPSEYRSCEAWRWFD